MRNNPLMARDMFYQPAKQSFILSKLSCFETTHNESAHTDHARCTPSISITRLL